MTTHDLHPTVERVATDIAETETRGSATTEPWAESETGARP